MHIISSKFNWTHLELLPSSSNTTESLESPPFPTASPPDVVEKLVLRPAAELGVVAAEESSTLVEDGYGD